MSVELQANFFRLIFGDHRGFVCIATDTSNRGDFRQRFFQWPIDESKILTHVKKSTTSNLNTWFCVNLLKTKSTKKESGMIDSNLLWADLDACDPDSVEPKPQVVIESSPGHYQAIWLIDQDLPPALAEDYSKRIAYQYSPNGVDKTGWDLSQLLRVPYTFNVKPEYKKPQVKLLRALNKPLPTEVFDLLAAVPISSEDTELDATLPEPEDAADVIGRYQTALRKTDFSHLWVYEPTEDDDWSRLLYRLELTCFEAGMTKEEVYSIAYASSLNKYKRDNRPTRYLWKEVQKAAMQAAKSIEVLSSSNYANMPELIPGQKYKFKKDTFVEEYTKWGKEATDACPQYHELSAFILLSSFLAGNLKLETSYGTVRPNIWGMILGDSTLTRKSTAMRMATDIIDFVDRDILLATDGSAEGILTGLAGRPGRTSMFFRDEVVGLFDSIRKKDYLAGIPQMFTQLYDGGYIARRLRKELITVTDPIFIFFGGGIKDQFFSAVTEDFIYSGFLPRFLFVSGETNLGTLRRVGPPTAEILDKKQAIYARLHELYREYAIMGEVEILGQIANKPIEVKAELSREGWELNGEINERMVEAAYNATNSGLALPMFERLTDSMLKMALLIGASRQSPDDDGIIQIEESDLLRAASYIQQWGQYTVEIMRGAGQSIAMRILTRALAYIQKNPGCSRSEVLRLLNVNKRQMQEIEDTLEARGEIQVFQHGKGRSYRAIA